MFYESRPEGRSLYVPTLRMYRVRVHRGSRPLPEAADTADLVCRVAPRLIAHPEEYPEANRGWTSHYKVESGKKCEVGEPVRIVS